MPNYPSIRLSIMVRQLAETTRVFDTCYLQGSGSHNQFSHEHFMQVLSTKRDEIYTDLINEVQEGLNGKNTEKRTADIISLAKANYALNCELPSYQPELLQSGAFYRDSRDYLWWNFIYGGEVGNDDTRVEEATQLYVRCIRDEAGLFT